MESKIAAIAHSCQQILDGSKEEALLTLKKRYPFSRITTEKRSYSDKQRLSVYFRDGFIDRYSGNRLFVPGILKVLSVYFPADFPYHKNGKMTEAHMAWWELFPTIDHITPISIGGADHDDNWVTTSMLNNSVKANWTLEQLGWKLFTPGKIADWDGLVSVFVVMVENDSGLLNDQYIKHWYNLCISELSRNNITP